jgi:DGQHR domain-containing protein
MRNLGESRTMSNLDSPLGNGQISIPALAEVDLPPNLQVVVVNRFDAFLTELMERTMMGTADQPFFGSAFLQGNRLCFNTSMPMRKMLSVSATNRARRHDTMAEVDQAANRPEEPTHSRHLRNYLLDTACQGEKFILPAFTFNCGVHANSDSPRITLIIHNRGDSDGTTWPAMLLMAPGATLDTTDGAHRRTQVNSIDNDRKIDPEKRAALMRNAVPTTIVFESNLADSHQDFADCAKAKPLPKSLVTSYDVRDQRNQLAKALVMGCEFLGHYVDATAAFVNLSARSRKIWSLTAVRQLVAYIMERHPDTPLSNEEKMAGVPEFFRLLARYMPILRLLDDLRNAAVLPPDAPTTGGLRERLGGDVSMRGVGMSLFALAFLDCKRHGISLQEMAEKLGRLDWHMLDCERGELARDGTPFAEAVITHVRPEWSSLLVLGETRYRISSKMADAEIAWNRIETKLFPKHNQRAAE